MTAIVKYIIAGVLVIVTATSCKKSWLDVTSSAQIRSDEQFTSETGFKDALIGVYIGMTNPALYARDMTWNMVDLLSQQYAVLPALANYSELQAYQYTTIRSMPKVDAIWNNCYKVIANINNALGQIDKNKSVLHPVSYSIIKGELLGLRAFLHFDLLRLYGYGNIVNRPELAGKSAIPYVSQFSKDITGQLSYAQTFELLQKDISASLELLKEDPIYKVVSRPANYYSVVNRDGFYNKREQRMNYYAVKALQARAFTWQGGAVNLASARQAAEEVIAASPAKLITPATSPASDRILYAEHVFNLNVTAFENIVNPYLVAEAATDYNGLFMLRATADALYETSNTNIGVPDKRYNTLLETQARGLVPVKLHQRKGGVLNIMPLIKLPEMYYIAAEYYIETDLAKAIDNLNAVRKSRGIIQDIPATATKTVVTDELMKEYRKEFISEGQLFFFYKRLGKTTFPGLSASIVANDKIYLLPYPNNETEFGNRVQ